MNLRKFYIGKAIGFLVVLLIVLIVAMCIDRKENAQPIPVPTLEGQNIPTNFSQLGTLSFPTLNPKGQDIPYLSYVSTSGAPTTTVELSFDAESMCATPTGAVPCMAMSTQFHIPFDGKRAIVEAIDKEARITVRKMRILSAEETGFTPSTGIVYIPWMQAVKLIEECKTKRLMQAHSLSVMMTLSDNTMVHSVEPMIDDVFQITQRSVKKCGNISIGTE